MKEIGDSFQILPMAGNDACIYNMLSLAYIIRYFIMNRKSYFQPPGYFLTTYLDSYFTHT